MAAVAAVNDGFLLLMTMNVPPLPSMDPFIWQIQTTWTSLDIELSKVGCDEGGGGCVYM